MEFQGLNWETASGSSSRKAVVYQGFFQFCDASLTWGKVKEARQFSGLVPGSHSEHTGFAVWCGERAPH